MLGPEDVGHRVVVRRIVGLRDKRPIFSDLLGQLVAQDETEVTVRTVAGQVTVPRSGIRHAKRVPDQRAQTATEALERVTEAGWPAIEREPLGEWLLRSAQGWTDRANSALPLGDPGRPLPAAVDAVQEWYRARGLPPKITVASPVGGRVTAELRRRGWTPQPVVLVQTAPLTAIAAAMAQRAGALGPGGAPGRGGAARLADVRLDAAPGQPWLDAVAGRNGQLPAAAWQVLTAVRQVRFAGVYDDSGAARAVARGAVADDGRWLGLSLLGVAPAHRRQGLAWAVTEALVHWAAELGAQHAYLQVEQENVAAVPLYARMGFSTHHTLVTWRLDQGPDDPAR